ncbi:MAG: succinylglutamate desuccinylase/aspartoacylase family protein [Cyclobacteriaceae bacterium]
MKRLLGKVQGTQPGPLIICVAAIHGNEQMGIHAFNRIVASIENHNIELKGKLIGIRGNLKAIESNRRFIDYDLNRAWTDAFIDQLDSSSFDQMSEDQELKDVLNMIKEESDGVYTQKVIVDLHATSSEQGNFVVVPELASDHPIIRSINLPVVVGLNTYLEGTMLNYYYEKGYLAFVVEGGVIGTEKAYELHTSALWEILDAAGAISHHDLEQEDHYAAYLSSISKRLPSKIKTLYRHAIQSGDGFRMLSGFQNFMMISKGQQLAIDRNGPIYAPIHGLIFMPLYQNEGDDGFFIVEDIS